MDYSLFKDINGLNGTQPFDDIFKFAANDLLFVMAAAVAVLFLFPGTSHRVSRRAGAVSGAIAAGLALVVNVLVSHAVDRARPFVAHPGGDHLIIHHARDASFPSDHTAAAFGLAAAVWLYDRLVGSVLILLAVVVGFSRVYVGVHYPTDVIGGAAIGIAAALVLRIGPLRALVERFAAWCAVVLARIVGVARPRAAER